MFKHRLHKLIMLVARLVVSLGEGSSDWKGASLGFGGSGYIMT